MSKKKGVRRCALDLVRPEFQERTWQAFWRMTVDGRTAAEITAEPRIAPNAFHQAKFRVLHRVREVLTDQDVVGAVFGN